MTWDDSALRTEIAAEFTVEPDLQCSVGQVDASLSQRQLVAVTDAEDRLLLAAAQRARWARFWAARPRGKLIRACLDCGRGYSIQLPWRTTGRLPIYCPACRTGAAVARRHYHDGTREPPSWWSRSSRGQLV